MLKVRLILVALLVPLAGAVALLGGTGLLHAAVTAPYENAASVASSAMRGAIAEFANRTVDATAKAASEPDVIAAIGKKQLTPKAEAALLAPAGSFGAPTFALLVAADGAVVARAGAETKLPASLSGLPVVAEALTGLARDGLWLDGDKPVHIAAAPSFAGEAAAGGVVLGWAYNNELVAELRKFTQLPSFIAGPGGVVGSLGDLVAENVNARESGEPSTGTFPILVPDRHRFVSSTIPVYGSDATIRAVTVVDRDPALSALASIQLGLLGLTGGIGLLILAIIASTIRSVTRPIDIIVDHLSQAQQQGGNVGILPEAGLTGQFLRLGKQINMLLQTPRGGTAPLGVGVGGGLGSASLFGPGSDALGAGPTPVTSANAPGLSSLPPSAPPPPPSTGAMLPGGAGSSPPGGPLPTPPPPSGAASASLASTSSPAAPAGAGSSLASLFDEPDPLAAFRVPPKTSAPPAPAPPPPAPPADLPPESEMNPEATVMFQVPQSLLAASQGQTAPPPSSPEPPPAPVAPPADDADDNRTVVAQVPQELLSQSAPKKNDAAAADEAHYKEVYEKFVQTRIECNEDTSDLTFDRFVAKLLKNRQQILEKHKAKGVRFQVYVKDGKAALRALPVRD
jgi:hypothetical protein